MRYQRNPRDKITSTETWRSCASLFALVAALFTSSAAAQDSWEFSPYRIRLWVVAAPSVDVSSAATEQLGRRIASHADAVIGAPWDVMVEATPELVASDLALRLESLLPVDLLGPPRPAKKNSPSVKLAPANADPSANREASPAGDSSAPSTAAPKHFEPIPREKLRSDKILVVVIRDATNGFQLVVREFDCRARAWGEARFATAADWNGVPSVAFHLLRNAFAPIARLENGKEATATFRLRASGLVTRDDSLAMVEADAVLRPYIRYNDRSGEPKPGGVAPMPWTYVVVKSREEGLVATEVHSGLPAPLKVRPSPRIDRFALLSRAVTQGTTLKFRAADKTALAMSGYDIFAKDPRGEEVQEIGRTDWRGMVYLPADDFPLRVVYVRNGASLLARLPIVPGLESHVTVDLTSDDRRLHAEGYLAGVQTQIMDLVAQRALLERRIGKHVDDLKFLEAEKLLAELKALRTRDELNRLLDQQQPRFSSPHRSVQTKISKLFEDTRKTINKYLDPSLADRLAKEIKDAQAGPSRSRS